MPDKQEIPIWITDRLYEGDDIDHLCLCFEVVKHSDHLAAISSLAHQLSQEKAEVAKWKDKPAAVLPRLVVCAVMIRDGKVLLEKRAPSGVAGLDGMWDLPGGKVEPQETPEEAIVREIAEELSVGVRPMGLLPFLPTSTWTYADGERRHWILAAFRCDIFSGEPACGENLQWFDVNSLPETLLEADRKLIRLSMCFQSENARLTEALRVKEEECKRRGKPVSDEEWSNVYGYEANNEDYISQESVDALLAARRTQERGNGGE